MDTLMPELKQKLITSGLATPSEIRPCFSGEITQIESDLNVRLPGRYKEFLKHFGNGAGLFLVGTDWEYSKLADLQSDARDLLQSGSTKKRPPENMFVFAMHQGYQFLFFDCNAGEDPPVYLFLEGEDKPSQVSNAFTEWLSKCIDEEIENNSTK